MVEFFVDDCWFVSTPESPSPLQARDVELDISQKTCTLEARPSVLVSVVGQVDSHLVPLPADRVFYRVHDPEHPNSAELPGVFVQRIFRASGHKNVIEQRTVRKRAS